MAQHNATPAQLAALLSKSLRNWDSDSLNETPVLQPDMNLLARIKATSPFVPKGPVLFGLDMARHEAQAAPFAAHYGNTQAEIIMTKDGAHINLKLTVAEQRLIAELETGEPCIRLWLTRGEHTAAWAHRPDFTHGQLKDGRFFCWRKKSDLDELARSASMADIALHKALTARILADDVS